MTHEISSLDALIQVSEVIDVPISQIEDSRLVINENMKKFKDSLKLHNSEEVDDEINLIIGGE